MNYKLLILFFSLIFFTNCKRDKKVNGQPVTVKDELPPATQEGKNTFGCLINDEVWLPKNYSSSFSLSGYYPTNISYDPKITKALYIFTYQITKEKDFRSVNLFSKNILSVGQYKLYLEYYDKLTTAYSYRKSTETNGTYYPISDTINSNLTITKLDTLAKIISGTFSFDFIVNGQINKVRNGVFDLKFN